MRFLFLVYDEKYSYRDLVFTKNFALDYLFEYLMSKEHDSFIMFQEDENDPNKVIIWSTYNIKKGLMPKDFESYAEFVDYAESFGKYGTKRFAEMPAIRISRQNYEQLEAQWQGIRKKKPKYVIFREHDNGYVDILEKNELSAEDIAIMHREEKIGENYWKRWEEYKKAHPEKLYPVWRSPEDNFFESDFALYDPIDEPGLLAWFLRKIRKYIC